MTDLVNVTPTPGQDHQGPSAHEDVVLKRIGRIVSRHAAPAGEVYVGDDAAVLRGFVGQAVISTDVAVAGVHLDLELFPPRDLGFKSVTSALSDLAAMGAHPRGLVVAVTAPEGSDLDSLHEGIAEAAELFACPVVGGDLSRGPVISVAVTVFGECPGHGAVLRSGAQPDQVIMVTGPLGASAAGLRRRREGTELSDRLVLAHRHPWPRLREGLAARGAGVNAMMDLSDGLALDLHRLCDASGVGFALDVVPVAPGATFRDALSGGEDYELLMVTSDPGRLSMLFADRGLRRPITLGRTLEKRDERTLKGAALARMGFEHDF